MGAPIFSRSNFGLELHLSNNDLAGPLEPVNYQQGLHFRFHPLQNRAEAERVRTLGEVAYNRNLLERALASMAAHPQRFLKLTALRFWYTWFPNTAAPRRDVLLWVLTLGWVGGLFFLWRADRMGALLLTAIPAFHTPLYYLIQVNVRHRYPVDWVLLLGAAFFVVTLAEMRTQAAQTELSEVSVHAV